MTCLICDKISCPLQKIIFKKMLTVLIVCYWFELENNYLNCNKIFKTEKNLKQSEGRLIPYEKVSL